MKTIYVILIALFACNNTNQVDNETIIMNDLIDFSAAIKKTEDITGDLHSYDVVFNSKDFISIYENPKRYKDSVITYLSKEQIINRMMIAVLAMNKLDKNEYIKFTKEILSLYREGKITENLLILTITYSFRYEPVIVKNYNDNEVILLLKEILSSNRISDKSVNQIEQILSGRTWNKLENYKNNSGN